MAVRVRHSGVTSPSRTSQLELDVVLNPFLFPVELGFPLPHILLQQPQLP